MSGYRSRVIEHAALAEFGRRHYRGILYGRFVVKWLVPVAALAALGFVVARYIASHPSWVVWAIAGAAAVVGAVVVWRATSWRWFP